MVSPSLPRSTLRAVASLKSFCGSRLSWALTVKTAARATAMTARAPQVEVYPASSATPTINLVLGGR